MVKRSDRNDGRLNRVHLQESDSHNGRLSEANPWNGISCGCRGNVTKYPLSCLISEMRDCKDLSDR